MAAYSLACGLALAVLGCGESPAALDAPAPPPDVPADPFEGAFDDPADLAATGCAPGSLAGFARAGYWPALDLRTEAAPALAVYLADPAGDVRAEHRLTADALFVRATWWTGETWRLVAIHACRAEADGTLAGARVSCAAAPGPCEPQGFTAAPLDRIAGETEGEHLRLAGEYAPWTTGTTAAVHVQRGIAYVARPGDGVRLVAVAEPTAPFELSGIADPGIVDLALVRGIDRARYLVTAGATSRVIAVDRPFAPEVVDVLATSTRAVAVEGTTAYLVDAARITAFDLSDPRRARQRASFDITGVRGVVAADGLVYAAGDLGLRVIDFRELHPRALDLASTEAALAADLAGSAGRTLVLAASAPAVRLLEGRRASPAFLAPLGAWSARPLVPISAVVALDDRAYVAAARDGIRVLDLAEPTAPALAGYFNTWRPGTGGAAAREGALGVAVDRTTGRVYVADSIRGLVILELAP